METDAYMQQSEVEVETDVDAAKNVGINTDTYANIEVDAGE